MSREAVVQAVQAVLQRIREVPARLRSWVAAWDADARVFALAFIVLLPLFVAPLLATVVLPGLDLGFHLAMGDMLGKAGDAASPYAPFYEARLGPYPYALHLGALAMLGKVMTLSAAHKLLVALYVAALPLSLGAALGACGRSRVPALLAFPVAYNMTLHYGFVSFAFSLPCVFLLLATVARFLGADRTRWGAFAGIVAAALLLYLCHLQNFMFGVLAAGAFIVVSWTPWRRRLLAAAALLPALLAGIMWQRSSAAQGPPGGLSHAWNYVTQLRVADMGGLPWTTDLWNRTQDISRTMLKGWVDGSHVDAARAILVTVGAYMLLGLGGLFIPGPRRSRFLLASVVVFLGAAIAYYGLPHHLPEYELMTFFPRFAPLLVLAAVLIVPRGLLRFEGWARLLVVLPALAVCLYTGRSTLQHYAAYGAETADFAEVMTKAEPGGRAVGIVWDRRSAVTSIESAFVALPAYYVALRRGAGSMTSVVYCGYKHMPCARTGHDPPAPHPWIPQAFDPATAVPFFDWFIARSPPGGAAIFGTLANKMDLVAQKGTWWLWHKRPL